MVPAPQRLLAPFRKDYWDDYRKLVADRAAPRRSTAEGLRVECAPRVAQRRGSAALDARIAKTPAHGDLLRHGLEHPDIRLHNNAMELAARRRVRTRDVRLGPQARAGAHAWAPVQPIIATATKLGVRRYDELLNRRVAPHATPSVADHIRERARLAPGPIPA